MKMKKINSLELTKCLRKQKRIFYLSLIFLLLSLIITYLGYNYENQKLPEPLNLKEISLKDNKRDKYAYIDVNTKPYLFASYEEQENKFYFVMDNNNYLYVINMSETNFKKLNKESVLEEPIRIYGLAKEIGLDLKDVATNSYNELMKNDYLTSDNFKDYIGLYYLDLETSYYDASIYYGISGLLLILFIITLIIYLGNYYKSYKCLKKYSKEELDRLSLEITEVKDKNYSKLNLYLTKHYLVDLNNNILILNYISITNAYICEYRYNGILVNKGIKIQTNNKIYEIATKKIDKKEKDELLKIILEDLKSKNKDIILGYDSKKVTKKKNKNAKNV